MPERIDNDILKFPTDRNHRGYSYSHFLNRTTRQSGN